MKLAGVFLLLLAAPFAFAAEPPASTSVAHREEASRRLGIIFAPPSATTSSAPGVPSASSEPAIVLPKFDVREERLNLEDHRLLTAKGRLAEAKRQELSPMYQKTFGPLAVVAAIYFNPLSLLQGVRANDAEAMVLFEQDERLRRMREADSLLDLYKTSDPATYKELKDAMRDTFRHDAFPLGAR